MASGDFVPGCPWNPRNREVVRPYGSQRGSEGDRTDRGRSILIYHDCHGVRRTAHAHGHWHGPHTARAVIKSAIADAQVTISYSASARLHPGTVFVQRPVPGNEVAPDSHIELTVSTGSTAQDDVG